MDFTIKMIDLKKQEMVNYNPSLPMRGRYST